MASVVLPPALPLPSEDDQNRRKQATQLRERRAEQAARRKQALAFAAEAGDEGAAEELGQMEDEQPPTRYRLGTEIGQVAAAEAGEGSSNEMHSAAYHGLIDQLIKVEKSEASLKQANARDSLGRTPLHVAVHQGHTHCVEALLSLGAAIDAVDESTGFTPLMLAAQAGQLAMCATLLRRGADLHATAIDDDIDDVQRKGKKKPKKRDQGRAARVSATELAADPEVERLLRACNDALLRDPQGGVVRVCSAVLSRDIDPPPPPPGLPPIHEPGPGRQRRPAGGIDHLSPNKAEPGLAELIAGQAPGTGLGGIMAASRFKRMMKKKKAEGAREDQPQISGEPSAAPSAANALALLAGSTGASGSTSGGGALALMAKAVGTDKTETKKSKETTTKKKQKTAAAAEAASGKESRAPVVLEDGSQVLRSDLRAPPAPPSLETLKEVNMLRRLVREEKAASEATQLTQLTRVYEQRERNWQRQVEAANDQERLAKKQAEHARAESETIKAMFKASQKDLSDAKNRMRQAVATERDAIERCSTAEREREIAEAAVARLEPVLEKLREDIAKAAEQTAQDKSTQEAAEYWRKQEKQEHEQEVARLQKELSESRKSQRDAEQAARELKDIQDERDRKDREEAHRQAWKREQEHKAKLIQRRFRKYKSSALFGNVLLSGVSAKKTKSADGVAEEERVLILRDSCKWIGPSSDYDPYCASILVSGLPEDADEVELLHLFEDCGPIASIRVLREEPSETNNMQRRSRGCAIVSYYTTIAAQLAMQAPPDPPKPPQEGEEPTPPPAGGKNGLVLKGERVSNQSMERVGEKQVRLVCTYADQASVKKAEAARIATPKSPDDKNSKGKAKGKSKGKGKGKGKGKDKGKGKPGTAGSSGSGAGSPHARNDGNYELMFSDERARWEAERAHWKRERKALLDYFESEREVLFSQTESVKLELQHVLDFLARVREMRYEDNVPPAEEEVNDYLTYLKIHGASSRDKLRWLAEEAMHAPLPYGWTAHRHPDTLEPYYYHRPTQQSSYEHPIDEVCRVTAQRLADSLAKQKDAHGKVASLRAELEARDCAIEAVEKAVLKKKEMERAFQEMQAMELLQEEAARSVKLAKGKQAKEEAKVNFTQAEERALEYKRLADEAELAFLEASSTADVARQDADDRTRKRQNRTPWRDQDIVAPSSSAERTPIESDPKVGSGTTNVASTSASAGGLPSAVAPPKNTLIVTVECAQSVNLGSDDSSVHGGRSLVACVVRVESWYNAIDATTVRRLPQDQTSPNEISWRQQGDHDDGSSGCQLSFDSLRGSREGLPTAVVIELRRRPLDDDEDRASWDPKGAIKAGDYREDGSAVLGVATLQMAEVLGLDATSWEREEAPRQIAADWYELVPSMAFGMGDQQAAQPEARPRTTAGRVRLKFDWLPPGTSSLGDLNTTAELNVNLDPSGSRPQSVGRAGTPLSMGPTTTRFASAPDGGRNHMKEDAVGMAQYTAAVE